MSENILYDIGSQVLIWIFLAIFSIILENRFGISKWLIKLYHHKIRNSEIYIRANLVYNSNLSFDGLKEYIKEGFRERYVKLDVHNDSSQSLGFMVGDIFEISVQNNPNNEISIQTNKIKTTMKGVENDVRNILNVLNDVKGKIKEKENYPIMNFEEKEFSLYLYLPYKDPFTKIYPPKNIRLKDYEVKLIHEDYGSIIKLKADFLNINTKERHELEELIKYFI